MEIGYITKIFEVFKSTDLVWGLFVGFKGVAGVLFVITILRKYLEGAVDRDGESFGLKPRDLVKNLLFFSLIIFSTQLLNSIDSILVNLEEIALSNVPPMMPLEEVTTEKSMPSEEGLLEMMKYLVYEALDFLNISKGLVSLIRSAGWLIDLFIYPFFIAERFFLLGVLQLFFPIVISLGMIEEYPGFNGSFF